MGRRARPFRLRARASCASRPSSSATAATTSSCRASRSTRASSGDDEAPLAGAQDPPRTTCRRALRRAQGGLRACRRGRFGERALIVRPGSSSARRPDRPLHLLAAPHRAGRRRARPRPARPPGSSSTCATSANGSSALRARRARHVQRDASWRQPGRAARDLPRGLRQRRRDHLGRRTSSSSTTWASGWSCRSGWQIRRWRARFGSTSASALAAGLTFRPLDDTIRETLGVAGVTERPVLHPESEAALLDGSWPAEIRTTRTRPSRQARREARRRRGRLLHHLAAKTSSGVSHALPATLDPADALWIAWPKKAAKLASDLDFETVQQIGLAHGLVDNKSCSIDAHWQALRVVYRLEDR